MDSESREVNGLPRRLCLLAMMEESMRFSQERGAHDRTVAPASLSKHHGAHRSRNKSANAAMAGIVTGMVCALLATG